MKLISIHVFFLLIFTLFSYIPPSRADANTHHLMPEPPGRLYDIGGYKLHLNCQGQGRPVIIIDSGVGGFSLEWHFIQQALSVENRVCTYDRAGYGWSDIGPMPRTTKRITGELHTLLYKAGIPPPYVFLGHSFGGYTALYYAEHYSEEIAGILLIDSSHPRQSNRLAAKYDNETKPSFRSVKSYKVIQYSIPENYPAGLEVTAKYFTNSWKSVMTLREEMKNFSTSGRQVTDHLLKLQIPMIVLSRGQRVWPAGTQGDAKENIWIKLQSELTRYSDDSILIIADKSGHHIHLDQPDVVVSATRDLITAIKYNRPLNVVTCSKHDSGTGEQC